MYLKRHIFSLCLCLLLTAPVSQALDVNVMSYNIRYGTAGDGENDWNSRRELLIGQLGRSGADTIGLQEALRFQIDEIRAALPQYGEVGIGRDGGEAGEYSCILYDATRFEVLDSGTFWLSETPEICSKGWEAACVRICTWALLSERATGERFYHYNTHLDHMSEEARLNGVRLVSRRIDAGDRTVPFVLTGDFNAAEDSRPVRYLKGEACDDLTAWTHVTMVDTFRVLHPLETTVGTFNRFQGETGGAKIDYILTAPEVTVLAAAIDHSMPGGRCVSDHFAVTASLRFPERDRRVFKIFQFPADRVPVIDGKADDWKIVPEGYAIGMDQMRDDSGKYRAPAPETLDVSVTVGWVEGMNRLYVLYEAYDNYWDFSRPGMHNDIFELVVDGDRSGGPFIDRFHPDKAMDPGTAFNAFHGVQAQNYHIFTPALDKEWAFVWGCQPWIAKAPYSDAMCRYDVEPGGPGRITLEFWITPFDYAGNDPSRSVPSILSEGKTVGLCWAVIDHDDAESEAKDGFWNLSREHTMYGNATHLMPFRLMPLEMD
ncbi:MAG: endonuclease/exonuclease/phosphatase family protein [Pontiellaceae bacterium]|nr:endonuclease/exonuclease/phosphatase family protein [Pontiellaceae bacterium]MBN2786113.1 endonuclease/exonuclease/phosphatase family protein [Pontiellaceae bacterium]